MVGSRKTRTEQMVDEIASLTKRNAKSSQTQVGSDGPSSQPTANQNGGYLTKDGADDCQTSSTEVSATVNHGEQGPECMKGRWDHALG